MTPIKEHKCELLLESGFAILKFYDHGWVFSVTDYDIYDIQYCTYCGDKLE